jgi:hypothetical protein
MRGDALSRVFNVKGRTSKECKTARLYADAIQSFSKLTPLITRTMPSVPHPWLSWKTAEPAQPMLGR